MISFPLLQNRIDEFLNPSTMKSYDFEVMSKPTYSWAVFQTKFTDDKNESFYFSFLKSPAILGKRSLVVTITQTKASSVRLSSLFRVSKGDLTKIIGTLLKSYAEFKQTSIGRQYNSFALMFPTQFVIYSKFIMKIATRSFKMNPKLKLSLFGAERMNTRWKRPVLYFINDIPEQMAFAGMDPKELEAIRTDKLYIQLSPDSDASGETSSDPDDQADSADADVAAADVDQDVAVGKQDQTDSTVVITPLKTSDSTATTVAKDEPQSQPIPEPTTVTVEPISSKVAQTQIPPDILKMSDGKTIWKRSVKSKSGTTVVGVSWFVIDRMELNTAGPDPAGKVILFGLFRRDDTSTWQRMTGGSTFTYGFSDISLWEPVTDAVAMKIVVDQTRKEIAKAAESVVVFNSPINTTPDKLINYDPVKYEEYVKTKFPVQYADDDIIFGVIGLACNATKRDPQVAAMTAWFNDKYPNGVDVSNMLKYGISYKRPEKLSKISQALFLSSVFLAKYKLNTQGDFMFVTKFAWEDAYSKLITDPAIKTPVDLGDLSKDNKMTVAEKGSAYISVVQSVIDLINQNINIPISKSEMNSNIVDWLDRNAFQAGDFDYRIINKNTPIDELDNVLNMVVSSIKSNKRPDEISFNNNLMDCVSYQFTDAADVTPIFDRSLTIKKYNLTYQQYSTLEEVMKSLVNNDAPLSIARKIEQMIGPELLGAFAPTPIAMASETYEVFKSSFINSWTTRGGSIAQTVALNQLNNFNTLNAGNLYTQPKGQKEQDPVVVNNFQKMYEETQNFYKQKLGKSYDTATIKLYRGINADAKSYVPGAIESWTTMKSIPERFGNSVLFIEVPYTEIMGSYESLAGWFPPEIMLKGKREYILIGGALTRYPAYVVKSGNVTDTRVSFSEWVMKMDEDDVSQPIPIRIVLTNSEDYEAMLLDPTTVIGPLDDSDEPNIIKNPQTDAVINKLENK